MKSRLLILLGLSFALNVQAGSATWNLNPTTGDWNTAANWTPATVPNGPDDVATFGISNTTTLSLSTANEVSSLVFEAAASPYAFAIGTNDRTDLNITGAGITNDSGVMQTFVAQRNSSGAAGFITFAGNATAGADTVFINQGAGGNDIKSSVTEFVDSANAGTGTFYCNGATSHGVGGFVGFYHNTTAASGTFVVEGGASASGGGGSLYFADFATAGDASITIKGTNAPNAQPGSLLFPSFSSATAGNATIVAGGGRGAGGLIRFVGTNTSGGTARFELFGNGTLDLSDSIRPTLTIGSLEGDGIVVLGANPLAIGSNSLSTLFSGVIQGTGSITKIGTGTLTLSGANTYTGTTTVISGVLLAGNTAGSATGTGMVAVNGGTLGGSGIITGAVGVGTGSGATVFLAPAFGSNKQVTLTLESSLTLQANGTYTCTFKARNSQLRTDLVKANRVTINGATITLKGKTQGTLTPGTVLTVISNTSANPISGTFINLPDGGIVTVSGNNFQANYEGGDGNDLTLTVVP